MSEADFLSRVMYAGRDAELLMHHAVNRCPGCGLVLPSGTPGFPDLVIAGTGGILLRELKTRAGVMSQAQRRWARMLGEMKTGAADLAGGPIEMFPLFDVWREPRDWVSGRVENELAAIASLSGVR